MAKVFIATRAMDEHAIIVETALQNKGHQSCRWFGSDFPALQAVCCTIGPEADLALSIRGPGIRLQRFDFDTVWYRRPARPVAPSAWLHPDDVPAASRESEVFWQSFPYLFGPESVWVNHWESRARANNKIVQLCEAKKAGLRIPRSLFGNDAGKIRNFITNMPQGAIFKTFFPMRWVDGDTLYKANTKTINVEALASDRMLQMVPGIFQERISKKCEIRATFMGNHYFAIHIDSQSDARGTDDFRSIPTAQLKARPCILPREVVAKCRAMMKNLNILFGSFDFIVDTEGDYVFLEVNEQGQFLWLEQLCPELPLLDSFTEFLVAPSAEFVYKPRRGAVKMEAIVKHRHYERMFEEDNEHHVYAPDPVLADPAYQFGVRVTA
ncbi:hypothetical protein [Massilia sp. YIM B04103]|uniref:hypothetical protein n=1 Tax=Massilia sp. YIM B04103 TaxID=2963106 RepID=UPI00210CB55A|nr:hypothetical protein [Massilia sp. YIM B04103]